MAGIVGDLRRRFEIGQHPLVFISQVEELHNGLSVSEMVFQTLSGERVRGVLCRPAGDGPWPVVLNIHAHGNRYDIGCAELMDGRPALQGPMGPALAGLGIASLCLDMPCFGGRAGVAESAAAKAALWMGKSLAGQMLGESSSALDWLAAQSWVRADRIGVFGISMGATLGQWLAAVDGRVRAVAHECCYADYAALIAAGAHDLHGIYLTIAGLVASAPNGVICGLTAPRAQFIGVGDMDPLTPPAAVDVAWAQTQAAYAAGGTLVLHREMASGHVETAAMRAAVLEFLARELG